MKLSYASALAAGFLTFSMLAPLASSAQEKQLSKQDVETIVKQVIQDNPDLIFKTVMAYQQKQMMERVSKAAQNLTKKQDVIQHDSHSPFVGNPKGDVTVAEFFDYHCGYCKRFYPELAQLLKADKNVRVVFKEFPILTSGAPVDDSAMAARAALAVWNVDRSKYFDYHILLMQTSGDFTEEVLTGKAREVGIDEEAFKKAFNDPERKKEIEANKALAKDLDITGTPGIVVGTEFVPGAISFDTLKAKVEEVRDNQKRDKGATSEN